MKKLHYLITTSIMLVLLFVSVAYASTRIKGYSVTQIWRDGWIVDLAFGNLDPDDIQDELVVATHSAVSLFRFKQGSWKISELLGYRYDDYYQGVAVGDIEPSKPGDEVVVVTRFRGEVIMLMHSNGNWSSTMIYQSPNIQFYRVAIGDIDYEHGGNEIVVVGESEEPPDYHTRGIVVLLSRVRNGEWDATEIELDESLISVAVGDFDQHHYGDECVVTGTFGTVTEIAYVGSDQWLTKQIWKSQDRYPKATVGDVYPAHVGNEIVIVGGGERAFIIYQTETNWTSALIWEDSDPESYHYLYSVAIGEMDLDHDSNEVLTGSYWGGLFKIYFDGETWRGDMMLDRNWDNLGLASLASVVIIDVDSSHVGNEIFVGSDTGRVIMLYAPHLFNKLFMLLPWIAVGFALIGGLNSSFFLVERKRMKDKKMKELGYKKCPLCNRYFASEKIDQHIKLHLSSTMRHRAD